MNCDDLKKKICDAITPLIIVFFKLSFIGIIFQMWSYFIETNSAYI